MQHTFSSDPQSGQLLIASKVYSDFGSHLPLIRSFSFGSNWPVEYPLYPGEPIRYHYIFYMFVGLAERIGIRIDLALNTISALGFFCLSFMIFLLSRKLFSSTAVGVMSVIFLLFNGSFSFADFFHAHPLSLRTLSDIGSNSVFPSFAPWNGSLISAFWNLNIYTNQRHLGLSFAVSLLLIYLLYKGKSRLTYAIGFMLGSLLLLNQAAFFISLVFVIHSLILDSGLRKAVLWSLVGVVPWFLIYLLSVRASSLPVFHLGYLLPPGSTIVGLFRYWLYNFGLHFFLIPIGLFFAPSQARRFWLPLLFLFLIPNIFRLSPDLINNHKLFNFFLLLGSSFTAYLILKIWRLSFWGRLTALLIFPFLILGGIIDYFPVKNDFFVRISDVPGNPDIQYFKLHTPPDAVILNDTWFFHPASLAGRAIFNGYPYFTWSYGYDQIAREKLTSLIYSSPAKSTACSQLIQAGVDYVELSPAHESFLQPNISMWQTDFIALYRNPVSGLVVYSVKDSCM